MSNTNTGGPAFPVEQHDKDGMTLRDYFAAKAMQGFCGNSNTSADEVLLIPKLAYFVADVMLKARDE